MKKGLYWAQESPPDILFVDREGEKSTKISQTFFSSEKRAKSAATPFGQLAVRSNTFRPDLSDQGHLTSLLPLSPFQLIKVVP
jgi:hypothetical protein